MVISSHELKVEQEEELRVLLQEDIIHANHDKIIIVAGHFPLRPNQNRQLEEDLEAWGVFTPYTFKLGTELAAYAMKEGREAKIALICDDHSYRKEERHLLGTGTETNRQLDTKWRSERNRVHKLRGGDNAVLPATFQEIMELNGLSIDVILRHDHAKAGRTKGLYFSESVLRRPTPDMPNVSHACSSEYLRFVQQPPVNDSYVIGFIPTRCSHFVCDVMDFHVDTQGSHVFMGTTEEEKPASIYQREPGVWLHKKTKGR
jgi:hypothetical protein